MLKEKWNQIVQDKNTTLIAGCDPILDKNISSKDWVINYINEIGPFVAGVKCNSGFFQSVEGMETLSEIIKLSKKYNFINIIDPKISDIGSTNNAWIQAYKSLGFDIITIAPYSGNIEETIKMCKDQDIAVFNMGLMSNKEFIKEADFIKNNEPLWKYRVRVSIENKVDGLVLGATYKRDDSLLIDFTNLIKDEDMLLLVPGIGAQGGNIDDFLSSMIYYNINVKNCMLNVGRQLMYPENNSKNPYREEAEKLNKLIQKYL